MINEFDLSRLSNAGKEAARSHKHLRKAADKLETVVEEALAAGLTTNQVEVAMLKFCSTRDEVIDATSVFLAITQIKAKKGPT